MPYTSLWRSSTDEVLTSGFPSRALWSCLTVERTPAACSPPMTEIRELGHIHIMFGLQS